MRRGKGLQKLDIKGLATMKEAASFCHEFNFIPASYDAWIPADVDKDAWIQVDFLKGKLLQGILTWGGADSNAYVTAYRLSYSNDGSIWKDYMEDGVVKVSLSVRLILLQQYMFEYLLQSLSPASTLICESHGM